jgi:DnaJ-domain-containing protein 1
MYREKKPKQPEVDNSNVQVLKEESKSKQPRVPRMIFKDGPSGEHAVITEARKTLKEAWLANSLSPLHKAIQSVTKTIKKHTNKGDEEAVVKLLQKWLEMAKERID